MKFSLLILVALLTACSPYPEKETLSIQSGKKEVAVFHVEVARNDRTRTQGLMGRTSLADDAGMLFVFEREEPTAFWMKNTLIPLDMIFIAGNGKIESIHPMAEPKSLKIIKSKGPIIAGLEIKGGRALKLGLKPGQQVISPSLPKLLDKP